jgi:cytochrome c oxidase subunit 3
MTSAAPVPRVRRTPPLLVGTVVWLSSELMFFAGLFAAYFTMRAQATGAWPPHDVHLEPGIAAVFTALLVASSGTMQMSVTALSENRVRAFRWWVVATLVLAGAFLANQAREWAVADFSPSSHAYGGAFYVMTGFHGLHVIGGMLAMLVVLGRSALPGFGPADVASVEVVTYYWHFVDVVWIGLFATLFFVR